MQNNVTQGERISKNTRFQIIERISTSQHPKAPATHSRLIVWVRNHLLKTTAVVLGLALFLQPTLSHAGPITIPVRGRLVDTVVTEVGFEGTLAGAGLLNTDFFCATLQVEPLLIPGFLVFEIECDWSSRKGTFQTHVGLVMAADGTAEFSSLHEVVSGTGRYEGMTGKLHFTGKSSDAADGIQPGDRFSGEMTGEITLRLPNKGKW